MRPTRVSWVWCLGILASSAELDLAQRYFSARRHRVKEVASLVQSQDPVSQLGERWSTAQRWQVAVRLTRVDGRRPQKPDLYVNYRLVTFERGPIARWVIELSSPQWPQGLVWEQSVIESGSGELSTQIRPCFLQSCSSWIAAPGEQWVPTAGKSPPLGIQAPLFLSNEDLQFLDRRERRSEDFFGRSQGWSWPPRLPWPERIFNAQAEAIFIKELGP
ncbi:MAG: hypothetical protein ACK5QT_05840 [Oligoflexia bacterium]|jgi:hypothetical protein